MLNAVKHLHSSGGGEATYRKLLVCAFARQANNLRHIAAKNPPA